jgi:wobble nucleotide-excising tRNase
MIKSISIAKVASYSEEGTAITGLKKINFIYGANATGKTTISNFLGDNDREEFSGCSVEWDGDRPLKTLVYNKKFREKNFSTGKIAGVFTLGKATAEEVAVIEEKKARSGELETEQKKQKETLEVQQGQVDSLESEFKETCWKTYKKYEGDFKEALAGSIGSKERFKTKLIDESRKNTSDLFSHAELLKMSSTILGEVPRLIPELPIITYDDISAVESNEIWLKSIVGRDDLDISALITKLGNNDWVNQGRGFLQPDDPTCPFCQAQTITEEFRGKIEEYFDEEFEKGQEAIHNQQQIYDLIIARVLHALQTIEVSETPNSETKLDLKTFSAHLKAIRSQFAENCALIQRKSEKASQSIELVKTDEELKSILTLIEKANLEIEEYNKIVRNYEQERSRLIKAIWRFFVDELKDPYQQFATKKSGLESGVKNITEQIDQREKQIGKLDDEIRLLTRNMTSVQPSVDEINRLLDAYGFHNFKVVPAKAENHYTIEREDGSLAHTTLSEGEITFITFLYYLQWAKGDVKKEAVAADRVLVIDDPISSLDSNVLFVISSLVKEIIGNIKKGVGNIKQLLLLTHNVYFHKEVSFIDGRTKANGQTHYWILRKANKVSTIHPYEQKNPIESSYELLWRELKEWEKNSGITIQNTMRRIIENYFKILGKYGDDELINKFPSAEEKDICRSLVCWINDGSHCLPDDLFIEIPADSVQRYLDVFKAIFEHTDNIGHYNMMMGVDRS